MAAFKRLFKRVTGFKLLSLLQLQEGFNLCQGASLRNGSTEFGSARCSTEIVRSEAAEFTNCDVFSFEVNQSFQVFVGDLHLVFKGQIR
ncbi:Uncharacterised protein [Mycobacterium tuberculosis]|nr:Uncharacterised protein [Mycobacterium tuberculosis]CKU65352.1 Uncharacterised protein [Mycobacterium tuberculosis]